MLDPAILDRAILWLDERFGLDVVWLFGSEARGTATSDSDVDLAALFRSPSSPAELLDARVEAGALLGRTVDLVDLDRASPILMMQVLRHGTLLLDRNPSRRVCLVAAAPGKYEDLMLVRREGERLLLERVRNARP
ncbi:MAG: nucleotidyltransferase domain-containing protein [Chloroflexi bacterium]|nr:nucleotidyltransferase domain-containing protein [Chloroflexota bacterium]